MRPPSKLLEADHGQPGQRMDARAAQKAERSYQALETVESALFGVNAEASMDRDETCNQFRIASQRVKTATSGDTLKNDGTFGGTFQNVIE